MPVPIMTRAAKRSFILRTSFLQITLFCASIVVAQSPGSLIDVKIAPDESEAVLSILSKEDAQLAILDRDWRTILLFLQRLAH